LVKGLLAGLRVHLRALARGDPLDPRKQLGLAEDDLYERVASMLGTGPAPVEPSPGTRRRALLRCEEYMHSYTDWRFSLSDLCVAAECSERTLRTVFRECYGTSPMAFVKRLRLQRLRQGLRDASPHSTTVLNLALQWGFWHMGHLGRDYKLLFGETPGETLSGTRRPRGAATVARAQRTLADARAEGEGCGASPRPADVCGLGERGRTW
jgi:transcriptional regulator GlxA family with amidase domain